jgi:hypothetical protein
VFDLGPAQQELSSWLKSLQQIPSRVNVLNSCLNSGEVVKTAISRARKMPNPSICWRQTHERLPTVSGVRLTPWRRRLSTSSTD